MGDLEGFKPNPPGPNQSQLAGYPAGDRSTHLTPFDVRLPLGQALGYGNSVDSNGDKAAPSGLGFFLWGSIPGADAPGYHMPPLRGSALGQAQKVGLALRAGLNWE